MAVQLAPARLVQDAAAPAGSQHVQLGFAHRSLQAEEQAVVEVRRIVETVLIESC